MLFREKTGSAQSFCSAISAVTVLVYWHDNLHMIQTHLIIRKETVTCMG
jgi:hypothetical protein